MKRQCCHCESTAKPKTEVKITGKNKEKRTFCAGCGLTLLTKVRVGDGGLIERINLSDIINACQDIMDSNGTTTNAKAASLELQVAAQIMSLLIMEGRFWGEK